jgi:glycosyltransferase involved in cell wall biosynthesis
MDIWFVNHYAAPKDAATGMRHAALAEHLQRRGHKVTVFAAAVGHQGGAAAGSVSIPAGKRFVDQKHGGVAWRFVRVSHYGNAIQRVFNMRSFRRNILRAYQDLPPPQVVVGSTVHPYAVDAAIQMARSLPAAFVYEVRDIWPESLLDVGALSRWSPLYWEFRRLEKKAYRCADGVIVLFPGMQPYLERHRISAERVCYIPNGVDPGVYPDIEPSPKGDRFHFVYFGSHGNANGLSTLVEAAKYVQDDPRGGDIAVRFIGDGVQKPHLMQRAAQLGLTNVEFLPQMPRQKLLTFVREAHAFVYCHAPMPVVAKYGMSANKVFDYLMLARPIVFSCDSYNDPVKEAGAGLSVPAANPQALAAAMIQMAQMSPFERQAMGQRGREYVLAEHNLGLLAKRLEEFFERLTLKRRQPELRQAA